MFSYLKINVLFFLNRFNTDAEIIKTIYRKFGNTIETPPTVKGKL